MPPLIAHVGHVEMFIHDSVHREEHGVRDETGGLSHVARWDHAGDDIDSHMGSATFVKRHPQYQAIICPSSDRNGMFGIAINAARA